MAVDGGASAEERTKRLGSADTGAKVLHALGLTLLMLSEYWRRYLDDLRAGRPVPDDFESVLERAATMARYDSWHRTMGDLYETMSFGEERAALWAAVFFAFVVRLNNRGPAELQKALNYVTAAYCAVAVMASTYYLASGGIVFAALAVSFGAVFSATRE